MKIEVHHYNFINVITNNEKTYKQFLKDLEEDLYDSNMFDSEITVYIDHSEFELGFTVLSNTCSMHEMTVFNQDHKITKEVNKVLRDIFKIYFNCAQRNGAIIYNCNADSFMYKMIKSKPAIFGFKKVHEYQGNEGIVYSYMSIK